MKFGVREICDVVFRAKSATKYMGQDFVEGQPVLYIDSATTSTLEGAATTVYAQGGKGNTRLIAWEGERTLTFTVEDALLSPISFAMLSGAGIFGGTSKSTGKVHVHKTVSAMAGAEGIDLSAAFLAGQEEMEIDKKAPIFVCKVEGDGSLNGEIVKGLSVDGHTLTGSTLESGKTYFCDFYVLQDEANVTEMVVDMEHFGGYFYVEASTLFRRQSDGKDMPAELTFPNVKLQSNFTFSMAATGDPSTFSFTMDAFPGYTYFDKTRKVLCVMQVVNEAGDSGAGASVMGHANTETITQDSVAGDLPFGDSVANG